MSRDCYECDLVSPSEGQECSQGSVCKTKESCSYWSEREEKYKQNHDQDPKFIAEAKKEICNKELKALCCPIPGKSRKI